MVSERVERMLFALKAVEEISFYSAALLASSFVALLAAEKPVNEKALDRIFQWIADKEGVRGLRCGLCGAGAGPMAWIV